MPDQPLITQTEIDGLKAQGYRVEDLNDNPHGTRVRGPNWKVFAPDGSVVSWEWIAVDAWVAARAHATQTSPTPSPG